MVRQRNHRRRFRGKLQKFNQWKKRNCRTAFTRRNCRGRYNTQYRRHWIRYNRTPAYWQWKTTTRVGKRCKKNCQKEWRRIRADWNRRHGILTEKEKHYTIVKNKYKILM